MGILCCKATPVSNAVEIHDQLKTIVREIYWLAPEIGSTPRSNNHMDLTATTTSEDFNLKSGSICSLKTRDLLCRYLLYNVHGPLFYLVTMRYYIHDEHGVVTVPGLVAGSRRQIQYENVDQNLAEIGNGTSLLKPKLLDRILEVKEESLEIKNRKKREKLLGNCCLSLP